MDDLIAFLRERIAGRKAMAVQAKRALDVWTRGNDPSLRWSLDVDGISINIAGEYVCVGPEIAIFLACNDPDTVLVEVDAKLRLLDHVEDQWDSAYGEPGRFLPPEWVEVLKLLALSFATDPAYRDAWKP